MNQQEGKSVILSPALVEKLGLTGVSVRLNFFDGILSMTSQNTPQDEPRVIKLSPSEMKFVLQETGLRGNLTRKF